MEKVAKCVLFSNDKKEGFHYHVSFLSSPCLIISRHYKVLKLMSETVSPCQKGSERRQGKTWEDKDQNLDLIKRSFAFRICDARILSELENRNSTVGKQLILYSS